MNFQGTRVFQEIVEAYNDGYRHVINEGGTSSSKTISAIQFLIYVAGMSAKPILISVVSETVPHLKRGCIRDFQMLMGEDFSDNRWNKSESIYDFGNNRKIEFFSADKASKLRGGRRDILFINECNNVIKEAFDELDVRTRRFTILDFNPVEEFYAHEMIGQPGVKHIHSTFLDAAHVLEKAVVDNILSRKNKDPNWWRVYGLGLVGKIEGLVHPMFAQCDELPDLPEGGREIFGLDFGYSMDPACLVQLRIVGETVFGKELIYERGLTNQDISKILVDLRLRKGHDIIIADSAEPKSIEELRRDGWDVRPAVKGPDSVNAGIQKVNQYHQIWTTSSLNCIKEQRNYRWEKNPDGKFTTKPIDDWNHGMDARRMALFTLPESKVLPIANIIINNFKLNWDISKVPDTECFHYAAASMSEDLLIHVVCCAWDAISGKIYVYHAESVDNINPAWAVPSLVEIMHLNSFHFEKFLACERMLSDDRSVARVFNKQFKIHCTRQLVKLRPPKRYDEFGAITLSHQMITQGRIEVHSSCKDLIREAQQWRVEKGKVEVEGLRKCLMMLISELDQREAIRPHVVMGGYKTMHEISYGF